MQTLKDFAEACKDLNDAEGRGIYELFEAAPDALRDEIFKLDDNSCEPTRSSLIKLGYMFGVKTLIEY
jgi:hypothetical protein